MLDVGSATTPTRRDGDADLAVFVDRIAAAGSDAATATAAAAIHEAIAAGGTQPGLRKVAEGLAASATAIPPAPRHSGEDTGSIVAAVRGDALVILDGFSVADIAASIAGLIADGRRVVVTAPTAAAVRTLRDALPRDAFAFSVDRLPSLSPAEMRELRRLRASSTPARRARTAQHLPAAEAFQASAQVRRLCATAAHARTAGAVGGDVSRVLSTLAPDRLAAVTSVAQCVGRTLGALQPRDEWDWAWSLLADLVHSRHRAVFERMLEDTAAAVAGLQKARSAARAEITGPLPFDALDKLHRYRDFLAGGGRARPYFKSPEQRDVQPVLRLLRVDGGIPESLDDITRIIEHVELGQRLAKVDAGCAELAIAAPMGEDDLVDLAEGLVKIAAAARSVGALRHDVLFIAENSPLAVPDLGSAERIAREIRDFADTGPGTAAGAELDRMADDLAALARDDARAPEHTAAVAALRHRDAGAYAVALDALEAARRDGRAAAREAKLLATVAEHAPMLAQAWQGSEGSALGFATFLTVEQALTAIPPADTTDVVIVAGAAQLGVERLLLAAVAPRIVAVTGSGDEQTDDAPSLLGVLQGASALVIEAGPPDPVAAGNVVRLTPGGDRAAGVPGQRRVGQAGA